MSLEVITLTDPGTGATAKILPDYGFNCYSFQASHAGRLIELLWSDPLFESGTRPASHSGIPILFPFPGRLRGTSLTFEGRTYPLEAGDGRGNALHGFALNRPWQVVERSATHVTGRFHASAVDPHLLHHWPADYVLTARYELQGNLLRSDFEIENPDNKPLPFGFGTHPYFRVPLGKEGRAEVCNVTIPTSRSWELADMLPTGRRAASETHDQLRAGMPFSETQFDDVFTGLATSDHRCLTSIHDPINERTMTMTFDDQFRECVVYNPPHRQAICIEPYTCVPDTYSLAGAGVDAGLQVLQPGETRRYWVEMRLD